MNRFKIQDSGLKIILFTIIAVAIILRLWSLDKYPAGLNADEAAIGYNAYSILQTGKDEYGQTLPLSFKSFGDYKPGLYFYFVLPFVAALGLNEWAVRLPSAGLGVGTVFLIYFLGNKIFNSKKTGLIAALLLAVSPWHIHFSRGGWETNAATFFVTLGIYLFLHKIGNPKFVFFSLLSFLISMYLYQSPRLVVPAFTGLLIIFYFKQLLPNVKKYLVYVILLLILAIPLILQFASGGGSERFQGLSFLSDKGPENRINELRGDHGGNTSTSKFFHNKAVAYSINFIGHYLDHFSPNFLFISGDPIVRNKVPETGQFFLICSLFLVVGLLGLASKRFKDAKVLIIWIITAPLASSMTYQTPHAVRALSMVIPLTLIMAYGFYLILSFSFNFHTRFKSLGKYLKIGSIVVLFAFLTFEFVHYQESYYNHYPKRYHLSWEYGFDQMVDKLGKYEHDYQKVVITDRYDQPYILVLFYKRFDPAKYQSQAILSPRDKFNFGTVRSFEKYEFREITKDEVMKSKGILFIGTGEQIPKDAQIIDQVNFPNGEPAFIFAKT